MYKILIVDDHPDILQVMELLLSSRGFEIEVTTKGEETFNLINIFKPDLIFLDIHLAGLDGRNICRQLKTSEKTKSIPIILFSANIIKDNTIADSLADEFIAKPFDIHELILKVNKLIGSNGTENILE